jgi:hypothetical protein
MHSRILRSIGFVWLIFAVFSYPGTSAPRSSGVPYSVVLKEFSIAGFPGLHSFAIAGTANQLVLIGGRTNGLHGFPTTRTTASSPSFPTSAQNDTIYVLDLPHAKLLGQAKVDQLPQRAAAQLRATNTQYCVRQGWLYILGGYGVDPVNPKAIQTLPYVTAINLQALTKAVAAGTPLDAAFATSNIATSADDPNLAVTGGDMQLLGSSFLVVFGHRLDGLYTNGGGAMQQEYTSSVRIFDMQLSQDSLNHPQLAVTFQGALPPGPLDPSNPYHRRDLTVTGAIDGFGKERIVAYGGVFQAGSFNGFLNPVYIDPDTASPGIKLTVDTNASQLLSQYHCGVIPFYSAKTKSVYTTFFGGISQYYWSDGKLKHDTLNLNITPPIDGLPFINSISTLQTDFSANPSKPATYDYLHVGAAFPPATAQPKCGTTAAPYLGAESRFVEADGVPGFDNGVLKLDEMHAGVIGYVIGGIAATNPYPEATCASTLMYTVTLNPSKPTKTVRLTEPRP